MSSGPAAEQGRQRPGGDLDGLARRFQRRLARRNAHPWALSTGQDLRFPTTTGMRVSAAMRLQHRYLDRVLVATVEQVVLPFLNTLTTGTARSADPA